MSASRRIDPDWPLVLLPGTLCDARVFAPWLAAIGDAPAMRGRAVLHADMGGCDSALELASRVLDMAPACFIPVGFSLGAIVAMEIAAMAPDRIGAMVLVAGNARPVPPADHADRRIAAMTDPVRLVANTLWPRSVAAARQQDEHLRNVIADMARAAPPGTLAMQTEVALTRSDKRPLLAGMTMPVLMLGGAMDMITPSHLQEELAAGLPDAVLHITPDAGHFLPLERPDFCAHLLADWLMPQCHVSVSSPSRRTIS